MTSYITRPATDKQLALITRLLGEKDLTGTAFEGHTSAPAGLDSRAASAAIDALFDAPRKGGTQQAEPGFYVRGDAAYRVVLNQAGTRTYAKRFVVQDGRASWEYAPGVGRDLAAEGLQPMSAGDAARIGLSHGFCVNCCRTLGGTSLSAHVSALIGYGETCAKNNGWPYPTGAAAQRAFIADAA